MLALQYVENIGVSSEDEKPALKQKIQHTDTYTCSSVRAHAN